jgi:hypothetical protein
MYLNMSALQNSFEITLKTALFASFKLINSLMLPRTSVPGVVRSLKPTHSPLDSFKQPGTEKSSHFQVFLGVFRRF